MSPCSFPLLYLNSMTSRMGNTLEQHRAAIGGNAARQLSRGWAPSTGLFKHLTTTVEKRKKSQGKAKATKIHITEVILLGFMFMFITMACPLVQRVFGYVLCDHGSLPMPMAGYLDSKVMDSGMQELLKGCWGQTFTERGTSPYFSVNLKPTMAGKSVLQIQDEDTEADPGPRVSLEIQIF